MSDALYLNGPDANMERADYLAEVERAKNCDGSTLIARLNARFVQPPPKTIDEMSVEEVLQWKYLLEEDIRYFRVHLHTAQRGVDKNRQKDPQRTERAIRETRPHPIADRDKANSNKVAKQYSLAHSIAELEDISYAEALARLTGKKTSV